MLHQHPTENNLYFDDLGNPYADPAGTVPLTIWTLKGNDSYVMVQLLDGRVRQMHAVVCQTFHPNPNNQPIVNHLDGDKTNYHPNNLEWASYRDNRIHAVMSGLTNSYQLKVWDSVTDKMLRFPSLNATATWMKVNQSMVSDYLRACAKGDRKLFKKRYAIAKVEDDTWHDLLTMTGVESCKGVESTIYAVNYELKKIKIYVSIAHVIRVTGIEKHRMETLLYGKNVHQQDGWEYHRSREQMRGDTNGFDIEFVVDDYVKPVPTPPVRKPLTIKVFNTLTQQETTHPSLREFVATLGGVKFNTVQKYVGLNGRWKEYLIEYVR